MYKNSTEILNRIKESGISVAKIAKETGVKQWNLYKWLSGVKPDLEVLLKIDDYLDNIPNDENNNHNSTDSKESFIKVDPNKLEKEAQLSSIMSNIKLEYLTIMVAEIQEKLDDNKKVSAIVSKIEMLAQADFENKLNKMKF